MVPLALSSCHIFCFLGQRKKKRIRWAQDLEWTRHWPGLYLLQQTQFPQQPWSQSRGVPREAGWVVPAHKDTKRWSWHSTPATPGPVSFPPHRDAPRLRQMLNSGAHISTTHISVKVFISLYCDYMHIIVGSRFRNVSYLEFPGRDPSSATYSLTPLASYWTFLSFRFFSFKM